MRFFQLVDQTHPQCNLLTWRLPSCLYAVILSINFSVLRVFYPYNRSSKNGETILINSFNVCGNVDHKCLLFTWFSAGELLPSGGPVKRLQGKNRTEPL